MSLFVTPSSATLTWRQTLQVTATGANGNVTWQIAPQKRGHLDNRNNHCVYTAPWFLFFSTDVIVTATDGAESASAVVHLAPAHTWILFLFLYFAAAMAIPVGVVMFEWPTVPQTAKAVEISPPMVTLGPSGSQQFTAGTAVKWSGESINSQSGLFQAPASITASKQIEITATSTSDAKKSAKATVILSPADSLSVTPAHAVVMPGEVIGFEANLKPADKIGPVTWDLSPKIGEMIDGNKYRAADKLTTPQTVTITATLPNSPLKAATLVHVVPNGTADPETEAPLWGTKYIVLLVLVMGAFGGCLHGMSSLADFTGNRQFVSSWSIWYVARPFVGGALALLVFLVGLGGKATNGATLSDLFTVAAIAGLVGMFSEVAALKLKDVFNTLLTPKQDDRKDQLAPGGTAGGAVVKPQLTGLNPSSIPHGGAGSDVKITGSGFDDTCMVRIDGTPRKPSTAVTPTELRVTLTAGDLAAARTVQISVLKGSNQISNDLPLIIT